MSGGCGADRHGDHNAYRRGCRCPEAREARRLYYKRWHEGRLKPGMVPAVGITRRLRALAALGWTVEEIAKQMGTSTVNVHQMRRRGGEVTRMVHDRVTAVYEQLSGTPGPSSRARAHATRAGWAPPLAWDGDTIDDPATQPQFGEQPHPQRLVDLDDLQRFKVAGGTEDDYAARVGTTPKSVYRAQWRARRGEATRAALDRAHEALHDDQPARWSAAPSMQRALKEAFGESHGMAR